VFSDGIAFHADLMNEDKLGEAWIGRILDEIETTDLLVRQRWIDNKQELRYSVPQAYNQFLYKKTKTISNLKEG